MGRWELETIDPTFSNEIRYWPIQWWSAIRQSQRIGQPNSANDIGTMTSHVMLHLAREWSNADADRRQVLLDKVAEQRARLDDPTLKNG